MNFYPENALQQLEFDKVRELLLRGARTPIGKEKVRSMRVHTHLDYVEKELSQTEEYRNILSGGHSIPLGFNRDLSSEIHLLGIPGSMLTGDQWLEFLDLLSTAEGLFRWFDANRRLAFPYLYAVLDNSYYEKAIAETIHIVLDENGNVRDSASPELMSIRQNLNSKRSELRRLFDRVIRKYGKQGYLADIEESFINGRRVLAVVAESKRIVGGVIHGESDSRQTVYIEPEETTPLSNEIFTLENEEQKEVHRILRKLTADLRPYKSLLQQYIELIGHFDFVRSKGELALEMNAVKPVLHKTARVDLKKARHPLLYLYNKKSGKETIPMDLTLNPDNRILVISGPNAGGKTVTMKTVALCQVMLQAGLLVPVSELSEMGIFKQLFIHIGDTQSLEFDLSTYSSHLQHMKYFLEMANGKTLFFIDELGSGSDPNLGGAFAEVIMEDLARKHSMGIVTTHYLNLKVMANRVKGIFNGAMQFDEEHLAPLYRLIIGKPGSSYTFSIAERIGLPKPLINRARKLVDDNQYQLEKLLTKTEQDLQRVEKKEDSLESLLHENKKLKARLEKTLQAEEHKQQVELHKQQNKLRQEQLDYLRDMERKLKALVIDWRRSEDKEEVMKNLHALLFRQKDKLAGPSKKSRKEQKNDFVVLQEAVAIGDTVKMKKNRQVGILQEIRGKNAIVLINRMPITTKLEDLVKVQMLTPPETDNTGKEKKPGILKYRAKNNPNPNKDSFFRI